MQIFRMNLNGKLPNVIIDDTHTPKTSQQLINMAISLSAEDGGKHIILGENLNDEAPENRIYHVIASNNVLINSNLPIPSGTP